MTTKNPPKILVVDDEPDFEDLVKMKFMTLVENKEVEFYFAQNGAEALVLLEKDQDINIIFTDLNMPIMDGLTLLGNLPKLNRIYKAIVISAYGDITNIRKAMNFGASDFIMKPVNFEDFEITLKKVIIEYNTLKQGLQAASHLRDIQLELDIAQNIQISMLPKDLNPLPIYPKDAAGLMIPAKEVGGDFFDFFPLDDKRCGIFIADVSGKSISACLYMAITKTLLRTFAAKSINCAKVLSQLNESLCLDNTSSMFVTAFYAILDLSNGYLTYCNAGHNYPYIISSSGAMKKIGHEEHGIPLGVTTEFSASIPDYKETSLILKSKECILLFTDGVTEAMNRNDEMFTEKRLEDHLKQIEGENVAQILNCLVESIRIFVDGAPQHDDITLLGVRYLGP